jgi:hypothetical protein
VHTTAYTGKQAAKGAGSIVGPRVKLDRASLSRNLGLSLLTRSVELLGRLGAQLMGLVLGIVHDGICAVEFWASLIACSSRLAPGLSEQGRVAEGVLECLLSRKEERHLVGCIPV